MFFRYNLFGLLWAILILLLGLSPGEQMPETDIWDALNFDKAAHATVFSVLCFLFIVGFSKQYTYPYIRYNAKWLAVLVSFLYGILIELGQGLIPGRGLELADMIANTSGIAIGFGTFYLIYKL